MGILDDAIREHLELKRRHGVTEDELQRQEEEALGPARRDVAQQHEEAEPAAAGQDTAFFDGEEPAAASEEPSAASEEPAGDPVAVDEPVAVEEHPADLDEPPHEPDSPHDEPESEPEDEPEREPEDEPEAELEEELEDEDGDNDVLEDTPDFLQETPEHDRLWFEQKPPRDFDFD
jgi:hypothetical protein